MCLGSLVSGLAPRRTCPNHLVVACHEGAVGMGTRQRRIGMRPGGPHSSRHDRAGRGMIRWWWEARRGGYDVIDVQTRRPTHPSELTTDGGVRDDAAGHIPSEAVHCLCFGVDDQGVPIGFAEHGPAAGPDSRAASPTTSTGSATCCSTRSVRTRLVGMLGDQLEEAGDTAVVERGVAAFNGRGNGADPQRTAYTEAGGIEASSPISRHTPSGPEGPVRRRMSGLGHEPGAPATARPRPRAPGPDGCRRG